MILRFGDFHEPKHTTKILNSVNRSWVFAIQQERVVNRDNTVQVENRCLQIDKTRWRATLAGCRVMVYEHLDGTLGVGYGPHVVGRYTPEGVPLRRPPDRRPASPQHQLLALTPVALRDPSVSANQTKTGCFNFLTTTEIRTTGDGGTGNDESSSQVAPGF